MMGKNMCWWIRGVSKSRKQGQGSPKLEAGGNTEPSSDTDLLHSLVNPAIAQMPTRLSLCFVDEK